jgi:hypothetical protein
MAMKQTDKGNARTTALLLFYFLQKYCFVINCMFLQGYYDGLFEDSKVNGAGVTVTPEVCATGQLSL